MPPHLYMIHSRGNPKNIIYNNQLDDAYFRLIPILTRGVIVCGDNQNSRNIQDAE